MGPIKKSSPHPPLGTADLAVMAPAADPEGGTVGGGDAVIVARAAGLVPPPFGQDALRAGGGDDALAFASALQPQRWPIRHAGHGLDWDGFP